MRISNFRLQVVLRLLIVFVLGFASYYVITEKAQFWLLFCWLVLFTIIAFIELIRFIEKSNRDLGHFLMAIKQNDFSNIYPENQRRSDTLHKAFNTITREFIKLRGEKESNYHFLKTVVEHSGVPLMAFDVRDDRIALVNESAKELFKLPHITKLEGIRRVNEDLLHAIRKLDADGKILVKTEIFGEQVHLSVVAKPLKLQSNEYKVIAFHNINSELDQKEIESWQKLIRVLTHEIKNSVIPISTLTEFINQMMEEYIDPETGNLRSLSQEDEEDLMTSLKTIEKRSKTLVKFVSSYGDLAKVPKPAPENTDLVQLLQQVISLEKKEAESKGIDLQLNAYVKKMEKNVDPGMIEQVVINLVKNSIEILEDQEDGKIVLEIKENEGACRIRVKDNGPGMDKSTLENIFVPFYTTKEGGSGIGLSLSRQLIRAHGGTLTVSSKPGSGAVFEINL